MVDAERSDEELAASLASGEERSLTVLIRRYEALLRRYVLRHCWSCGPETDDILQEVFLAVFRNIHDFDTGLKFSSWIYRITHNAMISHVRRNRRYSNDLSFEETLFVSSRFRADTQVQQQEFSRDIREILAEMSPVLREAFVLRFLEEKEYAEIGDILRENENTIATRIRRARTQFLQSAFKRGLALYLED